MAEEVTEKVITKSRLFALANAARSAASDSAEIIGEFGNTVKRYIETDNLHPAAFKVFCKLDGQDELKRDAFLRHLNLMCDMAVEGKRWATHTGDLVDQAEATEGRRKPAKKAKAAKKAKPAKKAKSKGNGADHSAARAEAELADERV